ncbi:hypothetical protein D3C80_1199960 [compost metagenome]
MIGAGGEGPAHGMEVAAKDAVIGGKAGGFETRVLHHRLGWAHQIAMFLGVADAAQFAPYADRGAADLLEGADPPPTGPGASMLGTLISRCVRLLITVNMFTVDVLGDIGRDITGGVALGRVYLLPVKAGSDVGKRGLTLGISHQFLMVIGQGVVLQGTDHPPFVGRAHKQQHVPVRGAVVMGFAHPKAIDG